MTARHRTDTAASPVPPGPSFAHRRWWERLRMWVAASAEIEDLTRDADREDRIRNEMAVHIQPGPWSIAWLFRRRRP